VGKEPSKEVKTVTTKEAKIDVRKLSQLFGWTPIVDGKPLGGPYTLPMAVRLLEQKGVKPGSGATIALQW